MEDESAVVVSEEEALTLRMWDGDDNVRGELLVRLGTTLINAIRKSYPSLSADEAEDVVCEAIVRFWVWREKYDPAKSSIRSRLYWFATRVAMEYVGGVVKKHQGRIREKGVEAEFFESIPAEMDEPEPDDDHGKQPSPIQRSLRECFSKLSDLQREILQAIAEAGAYGVDAGELGVRLGDKFKDGVPIPAGTIRTNKSRAWESLDLCMKSKGFDLTALGYTNG